MGLSTRRSNLEVIADILRIRGTKTAVMYQANMSYARTQKYLDLLLSNNLVRKVIDPGGKIRYMPSEKGEKFLSMIECLETFMGDLTVDDFDGTPAARIGAVSLEGQRPSGRLDQRR